MYRPKTAQPQHKKDSSGKDFASDTYQGGKRGGNRGRGGGGAGFHDKRNQGESYTSQGGRGSRNDEDR